MTAIDGVPLDLMEDSLPQKESYSGMTAIPKPNGYPELEPLLSGMTAGGPQIKMSEQSELGNMLVYNHMLAGKVGGNFVSKLFTSSGEDPKKILGCSMTMAHS